MGAETDRKENRHSLGKLRTIDLQALTRMGDQHLRLRSHGAYCPSLDYQDVRVAAAEEAAARGRATIRRGTVRRVR